jgi:radical SAM protein (TIGR01212 family)
MAEKPYRKLGDWLEERFGEPVHKIGVLAGFPCPNRDGTLSASGCTFCNPASSYPPGAVPGTPVGRQLAAGAAVVRRRFGAQKFIAYFQDCTPTNCRPEELRPLLEEAAGFPGVVGLAICTRPDCLEDEMLEMLSSLSRDTCLWIELGLQSASAGTLRSLNRNSSVQDCTAALDRLGGKRIPAALHVILGLPGETAADMSGTASYVNASGAWGVKLHNLHVLRGTRLEIEYAEGRVALPSLEEYAAMAAGFIRSLDPRIVVHRVVGDAPPGLLVAPSWMRDKQRVLAAVERNLSEDPL